MAQGRPAIPRPLERRVKTEAGHRCAIPTCRQVAALEIAHIDPWSQVQEHRFENLILLCAICHTRYDRGEIDRQSMLHYKANLAVISARYSDFERRILEQFAARPELGIIKLHGVDELFLRYLILDGIVHEVSHVEMGVGAISIGGVMQDRYWKITEFGRDLVTRITEGTRID